METKTTKKIFREPTHCILCHKHDNSHPNQLFLTKKKYNRLWIRTRRMRSVHARARNRCTTRGDV